MRGTASRLQTGVLKVTARWISLRQQIEILFDPQHLHHGRIGPESHARTAALHAAQGHGRHARSLRHLFGRQLAAQPSKAQSGAELA